MKKLLLFCVLFYMAFGFTEVMSECYNTQCHKNKGRSWCPENMVIKDWNFCPLGLGIWEKCCTH